MKQLCYLASPGQEGRFDRLFEELDILATTYPSAQLKSLTAFVTREKTLNQQNFLLLDLTGAEYSPEHILSAVQLLRRFSVARLIFIAPAGEATDLLFGRLAAFRVTDLITVRQDTDVLAELKTCLSAEGDYHRRMEAMQAAMATTAVKTVNPFTIPSGLVITVAVAGTMPRIGATTQVFGLYHYLKALGFHPAVLDESGELIATLWNLYSEQGREGSDYVTMNGIPFCTAICEQYDAYLVDMGVLSSETAHLFASADLSVLVGGAKPWELPELAMALPLLEEHAPKELLTLISFATDQDMAALGKYLGVRAANVPYQPDIWEPGDKSTYQRVVLPALQTICGGVASCSQHL